MSLLRILGRRTIYVDSSVVEQIKRDGREVGPEVGYLLIGINSYKFKTKNTVVLATHARTIGSAAGVRIGDFFDEKEFPFGRELYDGVARLQRAGIYDNLVFVGWAHTHPWAGGHNLFSTTDYNTQKRWQGPDQNAVALVGSRDGIAMYQKANGKAVQKKFKTCRRRKEFPKLEELV